MTDQFVTPSSTELIHGVQDRTSMSIMRAMTSLDNSPDDAAESVRLAGQTGVPSTIINNDLESFQRRVKEQTSGTIIRNNPHIAEYIASHPLAAQVSNDDWGKLDEASVALTALKPFFFGRDSEAVKVKHLGEDTLDQFMAGFHSTVDAPGQFFGFGDRKPTGPEGQEAEMATVLREGGWTDETAIKRQVAHSMRTMQRQEGFVGAAFGPMQMLISPFLGIARSLVSRPIEEQTGFPKEVTEGLGIAAMALAGLPGIKRAMAKPKLSPEVQKLIDAYIAIKPWADAGEAPPRGVHKAFDDAVAEYNDRAVDAFMEAWKKGQDTNTLERSPDMFGDIVRQHTDARFNISAEAVLKLYGDKLPTLDDGILGWVPEIAAQLELAKSSGAPIEVSIADFIAKADPKLKTELQDHISNRPGSITKAERTSEVKPQYQEAVAEPIAQVRGAAGLEPMFQIGDRKLTLERQPNSELDLHDFKLIDQDGKDVGMVNISLHREGKDLYIEMIHGIADHRIWDFGPALIRDIGRQLKAEFPDIERIGGYGVTGARGMDRVLPKEVWIAFEEAMADPRELQQSLKEQYWAQVYNARG